MPHCTHCHKPMTRDASRWRVSRRGGDHCSALCAVLSDSDVRAAIAELDEMGTQVAGAL